MLLLETTSVRDFLRAILPTEAHFPANSWTFRGQADACWGLTPSIRRQKSWEPFGGAERWGLMCEHGLVTSSESELRIAESMILRVLCEVIDRIGMDQTLRNGEDHLIAFAQHIGLPTRLLDWTRSPMVAAYFAASGAVRKLGDADGQLVVYGMSSLFLQNHPDEVARVSRLRVPGAGNPNMVAQQGEFIKVVEDIDLLSNIERHPIQIGTPLGRAEASRLSNHLIAITLPWTKAPQLLRTLRDQGIHAATVFPGQPGVAELVREVLLCQWRTRPSVPE